MRGLAVGIAVIGVSAFGLLALGSGPTADAATVKSHGITVSVPSSVTTYNGAKGLVKPATKVGAGVNEQVTALKIAVYKGRKRIAYGKSAKLALGAYAEQVKVTYKSWKYVTKASTKTVFKDPDDVADGGSAQNVACTVTAVDAYGYFSQGTCTSPDYPNQTLTIDDSAWCGFDIEAPYSVGEVSYDNVCYDVSANFQPYPVTVSVNKKVKVPIAGSHSFMTPRKSLKIVNGGHRIEFSGPESYDWTTGPFEAPGSWTLSYAGVDTSDSFGCVLIVSTYQWDSEIGWDNEINNVSRNGLEPGGGVRFTDAAGKTRFWVDTSCDYWALVVTW